MKEYKNAFAEVYEILNSLEETDIEKIPKDIIEVIDKNRNRAYTYVLDDNSELSKQSMLSETKAILFNLFRDYLCTEKQRKSIIRMQREERMKNEKRKSMSYHGSDMFQHTNVIDKTESVLPTEIKHENIWQRIFCKIRNCFMK